MTTDPPRKPAAVTARNGPIVQDMDKFGHIVNLFSMAYDKGGKVKVELALAKGKRQYDKRDAIAERDSKREIERTIKEAYGR